FGRDPPGFLRGLRETLLAQPVDRGFHVAARLTERGLAVHHARAGLLAQILHHRGGDICHLRNSLNSSCSAIARRKTGVNALMAGASRLGRHYRASPCPDGRGPSPAMTRTLTLRRTLWPWRSSPRRGSEARPPRRFS